MSRRLAALLLLLAAAAVWVGLVAPARRERDLARDAYARAREERERARVRVAALGRQAGRGRTPEAGAAAARSLRAALLGATRGLEVEAITIAAASEAGGRYAARGRLSAEGSSAELLRLCGRLAEAGSGLLVERVDLTAVDHPLGRSVRLELVAASARGGP